MSGRKITVVGLVIAAVLASSLLVTVTTPVIQTHAQNESASTPTIAGLNSSNIASASENQRKVVNSRILHGDKPENPSPKLIEAAAGYNLLMCVRLFVAPEHFIIISEYQKGQCDDSVTKMIVTHVFANQTLLKVANEYLKYRGIQ